MQLVNSVNCLFMSFQKITFNAICVRERTVGILVGRLHFNLCAMLTRNEKLDG